MGRDPLESEYLNLTLTRNQLKFVLLNYADDYSWMAEDWTELKEKNLIEKVIANLLEMSS